MRRKFILKKTKFFSFYFYIFFILGLTILSFVNPKYFFNYRFFYLKSNLSKNNVVLPEKEIVLPFDKENYIKINDKYKKRIHPITKKETFHKGIDFGLKHHCPIKAIYDGEVYLSKVYAGYGNCIIIKHMKNETEFYSLYAHLSKRYVDKGETVNTGEVIGLEGGDPKKDKDVGSSSGHHLHFEIWDKEKNTVDPNDIFNLY